MQNHGSLALEASINVNSLNAHRRNYLYSTKKKKNGAGRHGCDLHTVDLGFKSTPVAANVTH